MTKKIKILKKIAQKELTKVAHDYKHVERVRRWALIIAEKEGFPQRELLEAACLLHDIGLSRVRKVNRHGIAGAKISRKILADLNLFSKSKINEICFAIRHHNTIQKLPGELLAILRDADMLDSLGNVGIMRACMSKNYLPEYLTGNTKGSSWGFNNFNFDKYFRAKKTAIVTVADQINFQISFFDNLNTETAKRLSKKLIKKMQNFLIELEKEINNK